MNFLSLEEKSICTTQHTVKAVKVNEKEKETKKPTKVDRFLTKSEIRRQRRSRNQKSNAETKPSQ